MKTKNNGGLQCSVFNCRGFPTLRNQKQPPGVLFKKGVKNVTSFTGKQMCWSLIPIKFQAFMPVTLLKRDSDTGVFL